ncbi:MULTISPECIES: hypothetical protein [Paenibacillus]|uniref:SH3 domain-containing protein n=1 Tax=Paenibacillus vandeheii TaxID=3035917 RepID=A0ABT8JFX4_9BACL|nr:MULTISPECIES: hypothetical protein [Paenibacillus]KGP77779.1 hypothetical protein P363_0132960 [Paenibacillus sp. MAEPY1]KGP78395.1 hypothetical protein P364_0128540 [Paenibacillus sp. MAEPY2]MDN4604053.1 hypothetical protein [Paenibacillus vandeheii]
MLKKFIAASLITTTILPVSGAFAAEDVNTVFLPSYTPAIANELSNSDISTLALSSYYKVNDYSNFRKTPSPTGVNIGSHVYGDIVYGGTESVIADGMTYLYVYSYKYQTWGWVQNYFLDRIEQP